MLILIVGAIMAYAMGHRSYLNVAVRPDRSPLYVTLSDGRIQNGYTFNILNKHRDEGRYKIEVENMDGKAEVVGIGADESEANEPVVTVAPDEIAVGPRHRAPAARGREIRAHAARVRDRGSHSRR